jgi:hypothetical protein
MRNADRVRRLSDYAGNLCQGRMTIRQQANQSLNNLIKNIIISENKFDSSLIYYGVINLLDECYSCNWSKLNYILREGRIDR